MADKRTKDQLAFDMAKHGWAFCNTAMLEGKIKQCEMIAQRLAADDPRHKTLAAMKESL